MLHTIIFPSRIRTYKYKYSTTSPFSLIINIESFCIILQNINYLEKQK